MTTLGSVHPTVGIGLQKTLGAHMAIRADVAAVIFYADDAAAVILLPSISLTFPLGRYSQGRH